MIVNNPNLPAEELKMPPIPPKDAPVERPPVEAPPPYSPASGSSSRQPAPVARQTSTPASVFRPQQAQTVNHFELFTKHDALSGTYLVDPTLPSPPLAQCRRRGKKRDNVWGKSKNKQPVDINASFRTRHGAINLDLEVVAQSPSAQSDKIPAHIVAGTKHGRMTLDVHAVHPTRSLDLFVESKHGKIVLMLPPTFDGPLVFKTRNCNSVSFLPEFAARMRTIRASDSETVVLCTPPGSQSHEKPLKPINQMADDVGDRALVRTKHGKVIIGVSGLDMLEESVPGGGFFKAIGKLFESHGKAFGQYVETQAKGWERTALERSAMINEYVDQRIEGAGIRLAPPRVPQSPQPPQMPQSPHTPQPPQTHQPQFPQMPQMPQMPQSSRTPQPPSPPQHPNMPRFGGIAAARGGMSMEPDVPRKS